MKRAANSLIAVVAATFLFVFALTPSPEVGAATPDDWPSGEAEVLGWVLQEAEVADLPETRVYYDNCGDAWAAGAAPLHLGEAGYRGAMDGDKDGIACEPYGGY